LLYFGSGNDDISPPSRYTDAIFAVLLETGEPVWVRQLVTGDAADGGCGVTTAEREANCAGFRVGPPFDTVNGVPGHGGSIKVPGPTSVGGKLFIGSGYAGLVPGNVLPAFGVD
jgi:hypothetical protein